MYTSAIAKLVIIIDTDTKNSSRFQLISSMKTKRDEQKLLASHAGVHMSAPVELRVHSHPRIPSLPGAA